MAEKNLSVPYKSQWDDDAGKSANDCGPASIAMILGYYGQEVSTNDVFERTGAGSGLISFAEMQKAITSYGYTGERRRTQTPEDIKALIDADTPPIILVHYGSLGDTRQDKKFSGGHFMVVVGYRDDGYFVNDPNFKGTLRKDGDHHFYPKTDLERAWRDCTIDGNQPHQLLVIHRKQPVQTPEKTYTEDDMVKERKRADDHYKLYQEQLTKNTELTEANRILTQQRDDEKYNRQKDLEKIAVELNVPANLESILPAIKTCITFEDQAKELQDKLKTEHDTYEGKILELDKKLDTLQKDLIEAQRQLKEIQESKPEDPIQSPKENILLIILRRLLGG